MQSLRRSKAKTGKQNNPEITILLPVHNEAKTIEKTILEFYREIGTKIPIEIMVSEDGSTDGTKQVLLKMNRKIPMKLILEKERKGYMDGVKDGLKKVTTDYVFFVDSDGQHVASDFWKLYEKRDSYDMIVGRKIKREDFPHRILISEVFHSIVRAIFRLPVHDPDTAYRLINRKVLDSVTEETSILKYSFWTEFTVRTFKKGFKLTEVPVIHRRRLHGTTKLYKPPLLFRIIILQLIGLFKLCGTLKGKCP